MFRDHQALRIRVPQSEVISERLGCGYVLVNRGRVCYIYEIGRDVALIVFNFADPRRGDCAYR